MPKAAVPQKYAVCSSASYGLVVLQQPEKDLEQMIS